MLGGVACEGASTCSAPGAAAVGALAGTPAAAVSGRIWANGAQELGALLLLWLLVARDMLAAACAGSIDTPGATAACGGGPGWMGGRGGVAAASNIAPIRFSSAEPVPGGCGSDIAVRRSRMRRIRASERCDRVGAKAGTQELLLRTVLCASVQGSATRSFLTPSLSQTSPKRTESMV